MDVLHPIEALMVGGIAVVKTVDREAEAKWAGHHYSRGSYRRFTKQDHVAFKKRVAKRRKRK